MASYLRILLAVSIVSSFTPGTLRLLVVIFTVRTKFFFEDYKEGVLNLSEDFASHANLTLPPTKGVVPSRLNNQRLLDESKYKASFENAIRLKSVAEPELAAPVFCSIFSFSIF